MLDSVDDEAPPKPTVKIPTPAALTFVPACTAAELPPSTVWSPSLSSTITFDRPLFNEVMCARALFRPSLMLVDPPALYECSAVAIADVLVAHVGLVSVVASVANSTTHAFEKPCPEPRSSLAARLFTKFFAA